MDVSRLRVLVEVAHAGSIAAAARRMSFTPSAVSQQLAKLETELGRRLVERGPSGIRLTDAGALLVEHGEHILGELRAAEQALSDVREPRRVALGTFATAGTVLVPSALAAFRRHHPDVQMSLIDLEPPAGYGLVASGDLDVLITHRYPGMPSTPVRGLVRRNILLDPLRLVLPSERPVSWASLARQPWVSGGPGVPNRVCLEQLPWPGGSAPTVRYETADYGMILALVAAGLGVALVPASVLGHVQPASVVVTDLPGEPPVREVCIVHRRRPSALVEQLITLLAAAAKSGYPQVTINGVTDRAAPVP